MIVGSKYRHYRYARDVKDRNRLSKVFRVVCQLCNWTMQFGSGREHRARGWKPCVTATYTKLKMAANDADRAERENFYKLLNGEVERLADIGIEMQELSEQQEKVLMQHGDTSETWEEVIESGNNAFRLDEDCVLTSVQDQ